MISQKFKQDKFRKSFQHSPRAVNFAMHEIIEGTDRAYSPNNPAVQSMTVNRLYYIIKHYEDIKNHKRDYIQSCNDLGMDEAPPAINKKTLEAALEKARAGAKKFFQRGYQLPE